MTVLDAAKVLRVGILASPATLDPREAGDNTTSLVLRQVYETLNDQPEGNGSPSPMLFGAPLRDESGGRSLEFAAPIREGVCFSDGTPLTAEIALDSLRRSKAIMSRATVKTRGNELVFTLREPNPRLDVMLAQSYTAIVLEKSGRLLGTGPFQFEPQATVASLAGSRDFRLIRNPMHRGHVGTDEIRFVIYPAEANGEPVRLLEAMKAKEVDLTTHISSSDLTKIPLGSYHPVVQQGDSTGFLFFNVQRPALSDVHLRRAFAIGLDTARVAERAYERTPLAYVAKSILPPFMSQDPYLFPPDPREAERLLAAPGVHLPASLSLVIPWGPRPYAPSPQRMADEIARQFGVWNIPVQVIRTATSQEFFSALIRADYDMALCGWIADNPDPADFFDSLLHSTTIMTRGESTSHAVNLARMASPEMDAALARYRQDPGEPTKKVILDMVRESVPFVPLVTSQNIVVTSRRLRNFKPSAAGDPLFASIELG